MDKIEEVQKVIEHANNGDWIPLGILYSIGIGAFILLAGVWRKMIKDQKEYNTNNDIILNKILDNQHATQITIVELKTIVEYHKEEIKSLKK